MPMTLDGIRGWFLNLCFGYHQQSASQGTTLNDISLDAISVPVKLVKLFEEGKESLCYVVGGFHGIHSSEDGKHRPVMSLAVYETIQDESSSKISERNTTNVS